ncbi:MAG: hypothetical protein R3C45_01870 [Phycisphaerales bacterium]
MRTSELCRSWVPGDYPNYRGAEYYLLGADHTPEDTLRELLTHAKVFAEAHGLQISVRDFMQPVIAEDSVVVNDVPTPAALQESKGPR